MHPPGFISKNHAIVDDRGRAPDGPARLRPPNELSLVGGNTVHVTVVRAQIDTLSYYDWTGPETVNPAAPAGGVRIELPDEFARFFPETKNVSVDGCGVDEVANDRRCGGGFMAQRCRPGDLAIVRAQAVKPAE